MNLLVTGATGFVGLNFLQYLSRVHPNFIVYAPARSIPKMLFPNVIWIPFKEEGTTYFNDFSIDAVIHLVGKAHDTKNTTKEEEYFNVNYELTRRLYDAFLLSNAKKFIFLSTIKTVGDDKTYVRNALDLSEPQTPYARSKKKSEDYIRSLPIPEAKKYFILRPTLIYGPSIKGNLASLVKFAKTGFPYPFSSFENKRSYLSVHNLSYVFCTLLEQDYPSFTLNIANQDPIGTQEMLELLAKKMGKVPSRWNIPKSWIQLAAKMGDLLPFFPFNSEKLNKITSSFVVDTDEMEKTLRICLPEQTRHTISQII